MVVLQGFAVVVLAGGGALVVVKPGGGLARHGVMCRCAMALRMGTATCLRPMSVGTVCTMSCGLICRGRKPTWCPSPCVGTWGTEGGALLATGQHAMECCYPQVKWMYVPWVGVV